ncbi:DUF1345 domain-containing protein [Mesorhizobium sp. CAU 1732]|uniref:DUF1345 domain-containing protein n=1 Tax=Mesorhizobium sp. CAU 1732 TaxID=3140358 RepID=UPI0032618CDF
MKPLERHTPFYVAAAVGVTAGAIALAIEPRLATVIASNAFFATYLALTLVALPRLTAAYLRSHAASSDVPVSIIFLATLAAVSVAVGALFIVLNSTQPGTLQLLLAFLAVPLGWMAIHMMAAIHYAHLYWQPDGRTSGKRGEKGGLDFPGREAPSGIDFVYFSFVIGMTAQTSDVQITTTTMRRINIVHAIVSFVFNTVLVAAAVNAAVTLGN